MCQALYPKERYPQGHPDLATSLNNLGYAAPDPGGLRRRRGRISSGRWRWTRPSTPRSGIPRATPTWPHSLNNLGCLLQAQGDYGEARGYLERALAMSQALYPKERYPQGHPDLASSLNNLGGLLQDQGDYGEARGTSSGRWR